MSQNRPSARGGAHSGSANRKLAGNGVLGDENADDLRRNLGSPIGSACPLSFPDGRHLSGEIGIGHLQEPTSTWIRGSGYRIQTIKNLLPLHSLEWLRPSPIPAAERLEN